jgi:hypothetical protein
MRTLFLAFDVITSVIGIGTICYLVYNRFFKVPADVQQASSSSYEEGFSDAVKYFGLKELYRESKDLRYHMQTTFADAGIHHRITELLGFKDLERPTTEARTRDLAEPKPRTKT